MSQFRYKLLNKVFSYHSLTHLYVPIVHCSILYLKTHSAYSYLFNPSFLEGIFHESRNYNLCCAWLIRKYLVNIYSFLQNQSMKYFDDLSTNIVKMIY